jgi:hypothetical protein
MMAAIILVCSVAFLVQFFISYCRSLIAACSKEPVPVEVQEVTGIPRSPSADNFIRVVQLLQLCPERPEERGEIKAIGAYFRLLGLVRLTLARLLPKIGTWADFERAQCTHFAAVVLGRRIAFSRNLVAQQIDT